MRASLTQSLFTNAAKIITQMLCNISHTKADNNLEKEQLRVWHNCEPREAILELRIVTEKTTIMRIVLSSH